MPHPLTIRGLATGTSQERPVEPTASDLSRRGPPPKVRRNGKLRSRSSPRPAASAAPGRPSHPCSRIGGG